MARKGHLTHGRKDPNARRIIGTSRRQHEGRFRQIQLFGDALHRPFVKIACIRKHSEWIPLQRTLSEDVYNAIAISLRWLHGLFYWTLSCESVPRMESFASRSA